MGLEKLGWLADTFLGEWVISSAAIWPTLECIHFVSLCFLMGGMLMIDLRLTGFYRDPCTELVNRLLHLVLVAFLVNFTTGVLFFAGNAPKYIDNPAFEIKLSLIILAGLKRPVLQVQVVSSAGHGGGHGGIEVCRLFLPAAVGRRHRLWPDDYVLCPLVARSSAHSSRPTVPSISLSLSRPKSPIRNAR